MEKESDEQERERVEWINMKMIRELGFWVVFWINEGTFSAPAASNREVPICITNQWGSEVVKSSTDRDILHSFLKSEGHATTDNEYIDLSFS